MDITFNTDVGKFNFRVGAIIIEDGKVLMVQRDEDDFYYSVGGRVKMNETTEEAVAREAFEETGQHFEVDRLGFVHENLFTYDRTGERFTEIAFFYYMKVSSNINNVNNIFTEYNEQGERCSSGKLVWLPLDKLSDFAVYPTFFKTELLKHIETIKHVVQREK